MKQNNCQSFIMTLAAVAGVTLSCHAVAADSTAIIPVEIPSAVQPYLLEHGEASTIVGNYAVNINTIKSRCQDGTKPELITNITGVEWYGYSQAIEGVVNTLTLNPDTYVIYGELRAPVNVKGQRPNGASANWQVWCKAQSPATA